MSASPEKAHQQARAADAEDVDEFGYRPSLVRSLGSFHTFAVLAVIWGATMAVNLAWPRNEIDNATEPFHWYLQYGGILLPGIILGVGFVHYWLVQRHKTGVVAEHARVETTATPTQET